MHFRATFVLAAVACWFFQSASGFNLQRQGNSSGKLRRNGTPPVSSRLSGRKQTVGAASTALRVAAAGAVDGSSEEGRGTGSATIPDEVFNLVKSIVGAGVLSLPAGECVATFSNYLSIYLSIAHVLQLLIHSGIPT